MSGLMRKGPRHTKRSPPTKGKRKYKAVKRTTELLPNRGNASYAPDSETPNPLETMIQAFSSGIGTYQNRHQGRLESLRDAIHAYTKQAKHPSGLKLL